MARDKNRSDVICLNIIKCKCGDMELGVSNINLITREKKAAVDSPHECMRMRRRQKLRVRVRIIGSGSVCEIDACEYRRRVNAWR